MKIVNPAIPFDSIVVVIGANGYIGAETCFKLLEAGYRVRGTVRDISKHHDWMHAIFDTEWPGKFELVCVEDFTADGAFDDAFLDATGVIYVSTPQIFDLDPAKVIEPMVNGTINTLEAAARAGTQRYVLVSSSKAVAATVYDGAPHELTVDTFNSADMAKARQESEDTSFERMLSVYSAGRTAAELAFWKWLEDTEHTFVANCVVPDGNFGRVLNPDVDGIASTAGMLRKVLAGNWNGVLPQLAYVIDVQDTARLLVAAVALPAIRSERIFAYYKQATWNQLRHEVRRRWPGRSDIVGGDDLVIVGRDMSMADAPIRRAEEILKELGEDGFTSTEDMLGDFVASMYS